MIFVAWIFFTIGLLYWMSHQKPIDRRLPPKQRTVTPQDWRK
jgi:hypothetical protein